MEIWGNAGWTFSHIITFAYPPEPTEKQKQSALQYFTSLEDILPCQKCQMHYQKLLKEYPPDVTSQDTLSKWFVFIHNQVNQRLGKPEVTYDEAKTYFTEKIFKDFQLQQKQKQKKQQKSDMLGKLILLIILFVILYFIWKKVHNKSPKSSN